MIFDTVTNKLFKALLDGTVKAGDSKKLNGLTDTEVGESGARNLIPYPYANTTKTLTGIDFTDLGDGRIKLNGTATATTAFFLVSTAQKKLIVKAGDTVTLSGGISSNVRIQANIHNSSGTAIQYAGDIGNKPSIQISDEASHLEIYIRVENGTTVDNLIIEPMLEIGSVAHDYVPYHFGGAEHALDADTVGGYHASDLVRTSGNLTHNNIGVNCTMQELLAKRTVEFYTNWTDNENPAVYTSGIIIPGADTVNSFIICSASMGSKKRFNFGYAGWNAETLQYDITWYECPSIADLANFLPLDGSVPMSGTTLDICNKCGRLYSDPNQTLIATYNTTENTNNGRMLIVNNSGWISDANNALAYRDKVDGVITDYTVHHDGNSAKVLVSNTPLTAEGSVRVW